MFYDVLETQIRALPEEALEKAKQSVDFSFVDNIFGTLSDEEADELRSCCGLKFCNSENA